MPFKRYRTIVKVCCNQCWTNIAIGKRIDTQCKNCRFLKYNNVTRLVKFSEFLTSNHNQWIYINVYEYVKGDDGKLLTTFQRYKNEPITDQL